MRQIHSIQAGIAIIVVVALATTVVECSNGKRRRFYARSSIDLRALAQKDIDTVAQLEILKDSGDQKVWPSSFQKAADEYLRSFASSRNSRDELNVTQHLEEVVRNPLEMLRLLQRVAYFFRDASTKTKAVPALPLDNLKEQLGKEAFSFQGDLFAAAKAILRIQFMYNLKAFELAAGKVRGKQTGSKLQATHCLLIGLVAKMRNEFTLAFQWLKEAAKLARTDRTADVPTVLTELAELIMTHDTPWAYQHGGDPYFFMKQLKSLRSVDHEEIPSVRDEMYRRFAGKGRNCSFWSSNIWGLCSGENLRTPQAWSHLFCWHEFKVHKVFTIGPLKMEFLSHNPDVVQIHGSFAESEMKEAGSSENDSGLTVIEDRITKKLEAMAGLQAAGPTTMEARKVVNHIPGGHTDVHVDSNGMTTDDTNWITTFMIYLNDVEEGGYTVFPTSFATAVPSKGSAVFWFNTFSDGTPDFSTAHSDCPVVLGERSVFYKWASYYDQFSVRKCLLKPKERFQVLVNGRKLSVPRVFHHKLISEQEYLGAKSLSVAEEAPWDYHDDILRGKYSCSPSTALKSTIRLDWSIFENVKRILMTIQDPQTLQSKDTETREQILRYVEDFNEAAYNLVLHANTTEMEAVTKLAGNPLAPYRTFRRIENYVKKWLTEELEGEPGKLLSRIRDYLGSVYNMSDGPIEMDLEDAMTGILNTQFVHELKSSEISRGVFSGTDAGIRLSAKQCIEIGIEAIGRGFYYQAIKWMQTATNKVLYENDVTVDLQEAEIQLQASKIVHDRALTRANDVEPMFYVSPVSGLDNLSQVETRRRALYNKYKFRKEFAYTDLNLAGICQGRSHQTVGEISKLFCWYEKEKHPYLKIGPTKMEILSMHPKAEVLLYHSVLGEKLAAYLRNDTDRDFIVSTTTGGGGTDARFRISATSFVQRNASQEMRRIFNLMQRLTGLNPGKQPLNLNSYTPGGHFGAHPDSGSFSEHGQFTRLATLMFYITDPEMGGGTAFAQTGVHVTPKAGSAILWYNVLSSGEADEEMYHGGCPVIFGEKRVATQFMHHHDQHHLQCHTDPTRRIQVLVNGKSMLGNT